MLRFGFEPSMLRLFQTALDRSRQADHCRQVADALETRRTLIADRPGPAVARHTVFVWQGRAAAASRENLRQRVVAPLSDLGLDLVVTGRLLHSQALALDREAYELRRTAEEEMTELILAGSGAGPFNRGGLM